MNQDQLLGILRNALAIGGGYAIGHGYLSADTATLIGGSIVSVAPLVWTYFAHTDSAKIAAVTALPDVKKIITVAVPKNPDVAAAIDDASQPKVAPVP